MAHRAETVQQKYGEMLSARDDEIVDLFRAYQEPLRNCAAAVILGILNDPSYHDESLGTSLDQQVLVDIRGHVFSFVFGYIFFLLALNA